VSTITTDPATAVVALYDAFARRDLPAALACLADDIEWQEALGGPWGGLYDGRDAVVQSVFAPSLERVPDLVVTPEQVATSGDTVFVVHRYTGTVAATGAQLNLVGAGVWDVRDGRIARYRQFVDTVVFRAVVSE
jgi:uncharacterized protein